MAEEGLSQENYNRLQKWDTREQRCPGCGVKLKEGDLFTGGCERCSSSPVVDRDGIGHGHEPEIWVCQRSGDYFPHPECPMDCDCEPVRYVRAGWLREAIEGERLIDNTGEPDDWACNRAIEDILALLDKEATDG